MDLPDARHSLISDFGLAAEVDLDEGIGPESRRALNQALLRMGARLAPRAAAAGLAGAPPLRFGAIAMPVLEQSLSELAPGEDIWCVRGDLIARYRRDGIVRHRENQPPTEVLFVAGAQPSLAGALGIGLVRSLAIAGAPVLHGAALHVGGLTLLVLGASGAGKSTLCAAALQAGARIVSDDLVLIAEHRGPDTRTAGVSLRPFRDDVYLCPGAIRVLPERAAAMLRSAQSLSGLKLRLPRSELPGAFSARETLSCIAILGQAPRPATSRARLLTQAEGLAAMLPTLRYPLSPITRPPLLAALRRLVTKHPVVALDVGSRLLDAPLEELRCLLDKVGAATGGSAAATGVDPLAAIGSAVG